MARRLLRAIALAALVVLILPPYAGIGQSDAAIRILVISPPTRLALPIGQAVEVRCRVFGPAAVVELWSDGALVTARPLRSGSDFAYAWAPASLGTHCFRLQARGLGDMPLAVVERCVAGLERGSAVRVDTR